MRFETNLWVPRCCREVIQCHDSTLRLFLFCVTKVGDSDVPLKPCVHMVSAVLSEICLWNVINGRIYIVSSALQLQCCIPIPFKFSINDLMLSKSSIILDTNSSSINPSDQGLSTILPELAFQVVAARYITVGILAVSLLMPNTDWI